MASSSENMPATLEPWANLRSPLSDTWIYGTFARDNDALTKALQESLSTSRATGPASYVHTAKPEPVPHPSSSSENLAPKRRVPGVPAPPTGKISKRKSRATKRSPTTYITADPANFRQMVQQVTGGRLGNGFAASGTAPVVKPEPQRFGNQVLGRLPTLDTSAFLLDHHQQQVVRSGGPAVSPVSFSDEPSYEFDGFQCFPTLESWQVM